MEIAEKTRGFAREVSAEVKKVSWPSRKELQESTVLVIVTVIVIMIFVGIVDRIFSSIVELILG
jgi:preprotein translocase subunit SecE